MDGGNNTKKSRHQRACDHCRQKKTRCNASDNPNGICTPCADLGIQCTTIEGTKRRTAPKWYVEKMEDRMEKMERLLQKLHPGVEFPELGPPMDRGAWEYVQPDHFIDKNGKQTSTGDVIVMPAIEDPCHEDHVQRIMNVFSKLRITPDGRHYGASSHIAFVRVAMDSKPGYEVSKMMNWVKELNPKRREEYWMHPPWEVKFFARRGHDPLHFPPLDLTPELIENYFSHAALYFPILHRPTFMSQYEDDLHKRDYDFGILVLTVCAIGSRWSSDTRVMENGNVHSAGWKYFQQIQQALRPFGGPMTLIRLQAYSTALIFLIGATPQNFWMITGIGLRLCQDVGAQLNETFQSQPRAEQELWKRSFWCIYAFDSFVTAALGRVPTLRDDEFDVERPLEVDDEYWFDPDPEKCFQQPLGVPSMVSFFNQMLDLIVILNSARRSLFPLTTRDVEQTESQQDVLIQIDSAMNYWLEMLPSHLQWDPQGNGPFFYQASFLQLFCHNISIIAHRSSIPTPSNPIKTTIPSLAICTNAARTTSRILGVLRNKDGLNYSLAWTGMMAFHAAVVLLLNIWGAGGNGASFRYTSQFHDIHCCIWTLADLERRWAFAGKLRDVLEELASVGDFPLQEAPSPALKRGRSEHDLADRAGKALRTDISVSPLSTSDPDSAAFASSPSSSNASQHTNVLGNPSEWEYKAMSASMFTNADPAYPIPIATDFPSPNPIVGTSSMDTVSVETLLQLWSNTPIGAGWNIWDNFPEYGIFQDPIS